MTRPLVVDCGSRVAGAAAAAAGAVAVGRYDSDDPAKNLTAAEIADHREHGVADYLFYEDGSSDWTGGAAAGTAHGTRSRARLTLLPWPEDRPVAAAVDSQIAPTQYGTGLAYVVSFAHAVGRPEGVYGPAPFVEWCLEQGVRFACASSEGPRATLLPGASGPDVLLLQQRLRDAGHPSSDPSGDFAAATEAAVRAFQAAEGYLAVDGAVGQETWLALSPAHLHQTTAQLTLTGGLVVDVDYAFARDFGQSPAPADPAPLPTPGGPAVSVVPCPTAVATITTDPTGQSGAIWCVKAVAEEKVALTQAGHKEALLALGVAQVNLTDVMTQQEAEDLFARCSDETSF